jgi:hypothetical protein
MAVEGSQATEVKDEETEATNFKVTEVTGDSIQYRYHGMTGNDPTEYGNVVFLWQTSKQVIPRGEAPLASNPVTGASPDGSDVFKGISVGTEPYLVAYAVGRDIDNICATVWVPAASAEQSNKPMEPKVSIRDLGSTSFTFEYVMPPGCVPLEDGDWVGLWQGQSEAVLYSMEPWQAHQMEKDEPQGSDSFDGVVLERGQSYTVGYFKGALGPKGPQQSTLACSVTFKV